MGWKALELPDPAEGWVVTRMGDVAEVVGGGTPSTKDGGNFCESGGHAWLTPADLSRFQGIYISRGARNLTAKGLRASSATLMPKGTVLMSSRAPIGYVAVARGELASNQGFKSFICPNGLLPEYLIFWLRFVRPLLEEMGSGSTFAEISGTRAKEIPLLLAPVSEQRRIVAAVEALLTQVNAARKRLAAIPPIIKRLRHAVLEAACAGRLTGCRTDDSELRPGWRLATVEELAAPDGIFDGARDHGSRTRVALNLRTADYSDSGVRVIRLENLGHLTFLENKRTYISEAKYTAGLMQNTINEGDILFGSFIEDSVRVCLFPKLDIPAITKADCFCVRVRPEAVLREYLVLQLATKRTHDSLLEEVHGATRPRITTKQLRNVSVPLCSPEEQRRIVSIVQRYFALADTIERRVQAASVRAEKLPQAILTKAFSGELVPTEAELAQAEGRDYEPAAVLLERIRASSDGSPDGRGRGRRARLRLAAMGGPREARHVEGHRPRSRRRDRDGVGRRRR